MPRRITQVTSVRSALDRTATIIVSKNLEHCICEEKENGERSEKLIREAVDLLVKASN
ncbi:metal-sensing transcriptional repressor [Alteribacillus sp. YIM 98480]|uniref:metal-sensing transcriptional repressor n=1 Tax=Alteribacillus sp. YIM 98480 TaxID=2606599 RepID=UPI00351ABE8C